MTEAWIPDDSMPIVYKPDGTIATPAEIAEAMYATAAAQDHQMGCPVPDCGGYIEAHAALWMEVTPEGVPYLACVTWHEGGQICCSRGGEGHIDAATRRKLDSTFKTYAAHVEATLGATVGEDDVQKG